MKSIAFLGAKNIGLSCLKILIEKSKNSYFKVDAVCTNMNNNVSVNEKIIGLAQENGIPVYDHVDDLLKMDMFDFIISIQYHVILKAKHLNRARELAINLHMAPLPDYRGCNQFSYAIIDNAKDFGTTLHAIDEGIDSGDIIAESRFKIPNGCFISQLYDITLNKSIELFENNIADIINGDYSLTPQESLIEERGSMLGYRKDIQKLKQIDLSWSKDKIEAHVRATSMPGFEPPYFLLDGEKYYISTNDGA